MEGEPSHHRPDQLLGILSDAHRSQPSDQGINLTSFRLGLPFSTYLTKAELDLQFSALVEADFVQPGEVEAKKKRLAEKKRQAEADNTSRKRKKGASTADVAIIDDGQLGVKITKTS